MCNHIWTKRWVVDPGFDLIRTTSRVLTSVSVSSRRTVSGSVSGSSYSGSSSRSRSSSNSLSRSRSGSRKSRYSPLTPLCHQNSSLREKKLLFLEMLMTIDVCIYSDPSTAAVCLSATWDLFHPILMNGKSQKCLEGISLDVRFDLRMNYFGDQRSGSLWPYMCPILIILKPHEHIGRISSNLAQIPTWTWIN